MVGCIEVGGEIRDALLKLHGVEWDERFIGPRAARFCATDGGKIRIGGRLEYPAIYLYTPSGDRLGFIELKKGWEARSGETPGPLVAADPGCDCYFGDLEGETVEPPEDYPVWQVGFIKVEPQARRGGLGTLMYETAWYLCTALGGYFGSDETRSGFAERVWSGFARKGYAACVVDPDDCAHGVFYEQPHLLLYVEDHDLGHALRSNPAYARLYDNFSDAESELEAAQDARAQADEDEEDDAAMVEEEAEERFNEVRYELLCRVNHDAHQINLSVSYPEVTGRDHYRIPEDPEDHCLYDEGIKAGETWQCWRYILHPPTRPGAGLNGLLGARHATLPMLPIDDAADYG